MLTSVLFVAFLHCQGLPVIRLEKQKVHCIFRCDYINLNIYFPLFEVQDRYLLDFIYHILNRHRTFMFYTLEKL